MRPMTTRKAYFHIFSALRKESLYVNKWIRNDLLFQICTQISPSPSAFNSKSFNRTVGNLMSDCELINTANSCGIYRQNIQIKNGKKYYGYYITSDIKSTPKNKSNWYNVIFISIEQLKAYAPPHTRSQGSLTNDLHNEEEVSNWKRHKSSGRRSIIAEGHKENRDIHEILCNDTTHNSRPEEILKQSKWVSPEAHLLFTGVNSRQARNKKRKKDKSNSDTSHDDVDVRPSIRSQILILRRAYLTVDGWRDIIDDIGVKDDCSAFQVFSIRQKAKYLSVLLSLSLLHYSTTTQFIDICKRTINLINQVDCCCEVEAELCDEEDYGKVHIIKNPQTVLHWLRTFRVSSQFPNPTKLEYGKHRIPKLLDDHPDLYEGLMSYCSTNLSHLSAESIHAYLFDKGLPEIVKKIEKERSCAYTIQMLLLESGLKKVCIQTINNWMQLLGFKYEPRKKCYYVDNHEKPENVIYRKGYIHRYFQYELRAHRWIQIKEIRYLKLVQDGELMEDSGYKYEDNNEVFYEFHVDSHPLFFDECITTTYGGHLSVRKPENERKVMMFGQDECIFKQYSFNKQSWTLPDGTKPLVPKDEGQGLMLSSFTSRELGYGPTITSQVLERVNREMRGRSKLYSDQDTAVSKQHI